MIDELSHLHALRLTLSNEESRLAASVNPQEIAFRQQVVAGVEKEIKGEIMFLSERGIVVSGAEVCELSDDQLLEQLLK